MSIGTEQEPKDALSGEELQRARARVQSIEPP